MQCCSESRIVYPQLSDERAWPEPATANSDLPLANYQTLQSGSRISEPTRVRVNSTGEHAAPDNVFRISLDSLVVKNRIPLAIHSYSGPVQTSDMSPRPV